MDMEPAERNPAELRRTAFILIAIMIVGGGAVLYKYIQHMKEKDPNRPPLTTKIRQNFAAKNQHGDFADLANLDGRVWFVAPVCVSQLEENKHAFETMKKLDKTYADVPEIRFVLFSIDGEDNGVGPEQLAEAAKKLGIENNPRWIMLTSSDTGAQRGFIKDKLRLGLVLKREADDPAGKWKFPSEVALIDRKRHIRGRYDFKETHETELKYAEEVKKHPELLEEKHIDAYIKATERLWKTLTIHTDYVLNEPKP